MTIQQRFEKFHQDNPQIYELIMRFIGEAKRRGFQNYTIKGIFERVRWHMNIETKGDVFKLNNNYTSRYVRMIEQNHPELAGFFRTRELISE